MRISGQPFKLAFILAIPLSLAACGGAGGGVASTPPPSPPPPPPPATNADLITPTVNENFANDSASASVSSAAGGGLSINAAATTSTVAFTASNRSLALTTPTGTQTFLQTDKVAQSGLIDRDVFRKSEGQTEDRLELSYAGSAPVHSFRYVAGLIWSRGTGGTNLKADAISYGVRTADTAVPRTGTGEFDARLIGQGFWQNDYTYLTGRGTVSLNFGSGALTGSGVVLEESTAATRTPRASGTWSMSATLSSSVNAFSGSLKLYEDKGFTLTGPLTGKLYGPAANELGGAFAVNGTSSLGSGSVVGTLLAARIDPAKVNKTLAPISVSQAFDARSALITQDVVTTTNLIEGANLNPDPVKYVFGIEYRASDNTYILRETNRAGAVIFTTAGTTDAATSNSRFASYVTTTGNVTEQVKLYRPAGSNSELALTYSGFGLYRKREPSSRTDRTRVTENWFAYGLISDRAAIPATGTGSYQGVLHGTGSTGLAGSEIQSLEGTGLLNFDFSNDSLSGNFHAFLVNSAGVRTDLGPWALVNFAPSYRNAPFPGFSAALQTNVGANGQVLGLFYGPKADEVAGSFSARFRPPSGVGNEGLAVGVFGATKR